jgi:PadR family transcriptional regulator PadR
VRDTRLTETTRIVLKAFLDNPDRELSGSDIGAITRIPSGSRYPLLARLEHAGILSASWEEIDPRVVGRPCRRFYKFTEAGRAWAQNKQRR